jgi:ring-1,2-phenylacetyl-CoA epoxidase subunit PaaD
MVTSEAILDVLRGIDDPEMPISIVDLGLVEQVQVHREGATERVADSPAGHGDVVRVSIDLLPTFVGCPALPVLEEEVRRKVGQVDGVGEVQVRFVFDPPWSVDLGSARPGGNRSSPSA